MGRGSIKMPKSVANALTPLSVKNAKVGVHNDGGGLRLVVKKTGAKTWVYRFALEGKTRDVGLGRADGPRAISLANARERASQYRINVKAGVDPLFERDRAVAERLAKVQEAKIAQTSFKDVAEAYIAAHGESWRNAKHRAQWIATLATYAYPVMGDLPVAQIETQHVMAAIEPIWKTKPETASRLRGRIELVLDSARARGYRTAENPARWRGHIQAMLPARGKLTRGHHAALSYADIPAFMSDLRGHEAIAALALEWTILAACRTGEAIGALWNEIDLKAKVWIIPAKRMKAGKEHKVPLTNRMVELLEIMRPLGGDLDGDPIFVGNKGRAMSSMAMAMLLRRMGRKDITVHGFRSTFRDWAAESTAFPNEVCEMALAHSIGNAVEASYRRGDLLDKRRKLLEAWEDHCLHGAKSDANVTPIRKASIS
jgi:integrase